jgi:hypothetical protein
MQTPTQVTLVVTQAPACLSLDRLARAATTSVYCPPLRQRQLAEGAAAALLPPPFKAGQQAPLKSRRRLSSGQLAEGPASLGCRAARATAVKVP